MRHVTLLSYNVQLGRRNVQRIDVRRQSYVRLLGPVGPDEGIDLDAFDIVHVPESSSDLRLGRPCGGQLCSSGPGVHLLDIDDEHQRIVLLDLLHRTFGVEREHQNAGRVQARLFLDPHQHCRALDEEQGLPKPTCAGTSASEPKTESSGDGSS